MLHIHQEINKIKGPWEISLAKTSCCVNGFLCVTSRCVCTAPAPWWTQDTCTYVGHPSTPEQHEHERPSWSKDTKGLLEFERHASWIREWFTLKFLASPSSLSRNPVGPKDFRRNIVVLRAWSWWKFTASLTVFLQPVFLNIPSLQNKDLYQSSTVDMSLKISVSQIGSSLFSSPPYSGGM